MDKTAAVILAAGEGKRMVSDLPKVLHEVLFKPMIDWVVDAALGAGVEKVCVVVGHGGGLVSEHLAARGANCVTAEQKEQLGTGHAVKSAEAFLERELPDDVLVLNGDAPFISSEIIESTYKKHKENGNDVTVLSAAAPDPAGYGRIVRDGCGNVVAIVEDKEATPEQKAITEINAGAYWFKTQALFGALSKLQNKNAQGEFYLTDTVAILGGEGLRGGSCTLDMKYMAGANDRRQLMELNFIARNLVFDRLFAAGVTIFDDSGIIIGPDVKIGRDTTILPGTIIKGNSSIGRGCTVGPNSFIEDCTIGDRAVFNSSQARKSSVGAGATVGPFSNLRPDSRIADNVHIGDFVEIKNSSIGVGTKVAHLTYVGDSDVGGGVNFGCGVVTVNYDGVNKNRTTIGDGAFIGCNTNLIAPVAVGSKAYTGAGSTITRNVPDGALAVGRSRQENIEGWAAKKLADKKK